MSTTLFLHGDLSEEVYMKLPPSYSTSSLGTVCRLRKSLYGLQKSTRNWFAKLSTALRNYGFQQSHADYTLFTYHRGGDILSLLVYVDDIIIAGNNSILCTTFKQYLDNCFQLALQTECFCVNGNILLIFYKKPTFLAPNPQPHLCLKITS